MQQVNEEHHFYFTVFLSCAAAILTSLFTSLNAVLKTFEAFFLTWTQLCENTTIILVMHLLLHLTYNNKACDRSVSVSVDHSVCLHIVGDSIYYKQFYSFTFNKSNILEKVTNMHLFNFMNNFIFQIRDKLCEQFRVHLRCMSGSTEPPCCFYNPPFKK